MAKNKKQLSRCCDRPIYVAIDGAFCSQCDGNPYRDTESFTEYYGDEDELENYKSDTPIIESYSIEALADFETELVTLMGMVSRDINSIAPNKQWYPKHFYQVLVEGDFMPVITLVVMFTDGADDILKHIKLRAQGDCTLITISTNTDIVFEENMGYKTLDYALSDYVADSIVNKLRETKVD